MHSRNPVARSAVEHVYDRLLGRAPSNADVDYWAQWLEAGASVGSLYLEIERHASVARGERGTSSHPLSAFADVFTPENISFFTHRGRYRPLGLLIETVNICNNDCVICPYSAQTRDRRIMSTSLFEKVVDDYARIGGGPVSLTPMVGEVFLDKRLRERLTYLRGTPSITKVSTITNATMVRRNLQIFCHSSTASQFRCTDLTRKNMSR